MLSITKEDLELSRKNNKKLREGMQVMSQKYSEINQAKGRIEKEAFKLENDLEMLQIKLRNAEDERKYLEGVVSAMKKGKESDLDTFERERELLSSEVQDLKMKLLDMEDAQGREKIANAGNSSVILKALRVELGERDAEVQRLRKKVKEGERVLQSYREGCGGGEWKNIKHRGWHKGAARFDGGSAESSRDDSTDIDFEDDVGTEAQRKNWENARKISKAFGDLSRRLTMG